MHIYVYICTKIWICNTFEVLSIIGHTGYNGKLKISSILRPAVQLDVIYTIELSPLPGQGGLAQADF